MKKITISILVDEAKVADASYVSIHLNPCTEYLAICFKDLRVFPSYKKVKIEKLQCLIMYGDQIIEDFVLQIDGGVEFISNANFSVSSKMIPDNFYYRQNVIDILHAWTNNISVNWDTLDENYKDAWLGAAVIHSGLPKQIPNNKEYIIDCSEIEIYQDFYYLLGTTLFGDKGYFGSTLDGLIDCFIELKIKDYSHTKIILKNFKQLEEVFAKISSDYANLVIKEFEKRKFDVIK